jgi:hypothetical protein
MTSRHTNLQAARPTHGQSLQVHVAQKDLCIAQQHPTPVADAQLFKKRWI